MSTKRETRHRRDQGDRVSRADHSGMAGRKSPALVDRSTLGSLKRFAARKLLSIKERDMLTAAYLFLRDVEHKLQMVHDLQTHALPDEAEELARCAIRMGYDTQDRTKGVAQFRADHHQHTELVNEPSGRCFMSPRLRDC